MDRFAQNEDEVRALTTLAEAFTATLNIRRPRSISEERKILEGVTKPTGSTIDSGIHCLSRDFIAESSLDPAKPANHPISDINAVVRSGTSRGTFFAGLRSNTED